MKKYATEPDSAADARKNTMLTMVSTRISTMVRTTNVATRNMPPIRKKTFENVMVATARSSRRLNTASKVTLLGSRPSLTRIRSRFVAANSRARWNI